LDEYLPRLQADRFPSRKTAKQVDEFDLHFHCG
jgi:hypothetical protein